MKYYFNRIFSFIVAMSIFLSYSITVYALPKRLLDGTWIDVPLSEYGEEISYFIQYGLNQIGVIIDGGDFETWLKNNETYQDLYDDNGRLSKNISIDTSTGKVSYTKEIMAVLKNAVDDYAKENEPYYMAYTRPLEDFTLAQNKQVYDTAKNLLDDSPSGIIALNYLYGFRNRLSFVDIGHSFRKNGAVCYLQQKFNIHFYDIETWGLSTFKSYYLILNDGDSAVKTAEEFKQRATTVYDYGYDTNNPVSSIFCVDTKPTSGSYPVTTSTSSSLFLYSKEPRRIRVYNTYADFQDYTLGKRKVYYTSNYYNYVPEDMTASIDDLQKTVDDLSGVVDQLLDQITKDMDESEIEDLLKQILDELKNQQGTGGGGGSGGGGDTTVNVDMTQTNGLLANILAKVTQIFDKMASSAGKTLDDVVTAIDDLSTMLRRYLSEITGDLDDIKGQLEEMSEQEFEEKTDSFLSQLMDMFSEISEVARGKFPFSIPSDMQFLIARISGMSPEAASAYSYDSCTTFSLSLYSDDVSSSVSEDDGMDHGGGGASRPGDESGDHGGGGASRPGVSVDHGGGGASREPVTQNNLAPVFTLPIVIERYGIEEYVIIDMSMFDPVSKMSRTLFLIMYIICLYNMTFKVIGLWGDLVG